VDKNSIDLAARHLAFAFRSILPQPVAPRALYFRGRTYADFCSLLRATERRSRLRFRFTPAIAPEAHATPRLAPLIGQCETKVAFCLFPPSKLPRKPLSPPYLISLSQVDDDNIKSLFIVDAAHAKCSRSGILLASGEERSFLRCT